MDKKYSFLFSLLITLLIASNVYLFSVLSLTLSHRVVHVSRVIDGDTFVTSLGEIVRLANINSPEKGVQGYDRARKFLAGFENKSVILEEVHQDKYGRTLARLYAPEYINREIVEKGLATKFLVAENEAQDFAFSEEVAIAEGRGLWVHSVYYGCIQARVFPKEEIVELANKCDPINIEEWVVTDESRKEYKFGSRVFTKLAVHTAHGQDTSESVFWGSSSNVWNNDRDTLYVFDAQRRLVLAESYGYV